MPDNNMDKDPKQYSLLQQLFSIGGITLPEGNKLAIWLLVVVVIVFITFFYFFMNMMDRVLDKALNPNKEHTELVVQEDYNKVLRDAKILKAENQILKDSIDKINPDINDIRKETDSVIYENTQPYINKLKK